MWYYRPNTNDQSQFWLRPRGAMGPTTNLTIDSAPNGFSWQLGNGTTGVLSASWYELDLGAAVGFNAQLTSLTEVSPVPEPSTGAMLLLGAAVAAGAATRRARRAA